jgi:CHAD domain-containing protein
MSAGLAEQGGRAVPEAQIRLRQVTDADDGNRLAEPSAGMVLHRVLAGAARTFLLNDMGDELVDENKRCETVGALNVLMQSRPVWAQSAASELDGSQRAVTQTERIHQSRVAMRRIRSNLRTFRLALDPKWGTSLRAELAWYANQLGQARDLQIIQGTIARTGPEVIAPDEVAALEAVLDARTAAALADIVAERGGARRFQLTEQMMVLWDGPAFKERAKRPAVQVLDPMLHRAWHDLRGAARAARKEPTDAHLHKVRIRLKDLRYGCDTVALVEGGPARKTAKAAERLQNQLGDLHDAAFAIEWLEDLARTEPDLKDPIDQLVAVQRDEGAAARKGWKRGLKEVDRRWRNWHT